MGYCARSYLFFSCPFISWRKSPLWARACQSTASLTSTCSQTWGTINLSSLLLLLLIVITKFTIWQGAYNEVRYFPLYYYPQSYYSSVFLSRRGKRAVLKTLAEIWTGNNAACTGILSWLDICCTSTMSCHLTNPQDVFTALKSTLAVQSSSIIETNILAWTGASNVSMMVRIHDRTSIIYSLFTCTFSIIVIYSHVG